MIALMINATVRAIVLAGIVALVLKLFRVRNPHILLSAWTGVLVASLMMPLALKWSPIDIPVTVHVPPTQSVTAPPTTNNTPSTISETATATSTVSRAVGNLTIPALDWVSLVAAAYTTVAALLLLRLIFGLSRTAVIARRAQRVDASWAEGADVRMTDAITVPVSFSTTILVPSDYGKWSGVELRAVLAHEQSHITRGDFFVQLLARLNSAIFWYNPLSWWLLKKLIELGEAASDTAAIADVADRAGYANLLLSMSKRAQRTLVSVAMARPITIARRVERILSGEPLYSRLLPRHHVAAVVIIAAMMFVCAGRITPTLAQSGPSVSVDPKVLDKYVGYFSFQSNVTPHVVVTIARDGSHLYLQSSQVPTRIELKAESPTIFTNPVGQTITFDANTTGPVDHAIFRDKDYDIPIVRVGPAELKASDDELAKNRADQERPRHAVNIDPSLLDNYVGFYAPRPSRVFTVTREGDHLFVQMTGQPRLGLIPEGPKDFFFPNVPAQTTFVTDESGKATQLVVHQGGMNVPAARVDAGAAATATDALAKKVADQAKPRKAIAVDGKVLDQYVGRYKLGPTFVLEITRDEDHLFAQVNGQPKLEVYPETDHDFFYTVVPAQLTFVTSGNNAPATQVIFHQNGADQMAGRIQ